MTKNPDNLPWLKYAGSQVLSLNWFVSYSFITFQSIHLMGIENWAFILLKFADWHVVAQPVAFLPSTLYGVISCIFLTWPFRKHTPHTPNSARSDTRCQETSKKGVQLVWRRTFLIYTPTEEDSSNDAAFDLAPLDNVPPSPRQVGCLSEDVRTFSSTAKVSEDVSASRAHSESHGVLQISIFPVHVCYCSWTNDAETERRAVFNQYKRRTLLWPKLHVCFGNTERMQSKQSWKPFYSQAKTQFFPSRCFSNLS